MPATKIKAHRTPGPLTADEQGALLNLDHCPLCTKKNVFRRPWREDWLCGWCGSVFRWVQNSVRYMGRQWDLK